MALSTLVKTTQTKRDTLATAKPAAARRPRKADRDFAPEGSGLRHSRYDIRTLVTKHFERARNDAQYGAAWDKYYLTERERLLKEEIDQARRRDYALAAKAAGKPEKRPYVPKVRASELGDDCERKITFRLMQFPEHPVMVNHGEWCIPSYLGTAAHRLLEIALRYLGVSKQAEYRVVSEEYQFTGRIDHIIDPEFFLTTPGVEYFLAEYGEEAIDAVLDVKTVKQSEFEEGAWNKKFDKYRAQVNAYAKHLGIKLGIILLQSRDSGDVLAVEWDVDEDEGQAMLEKAKHAAELRDARQLGEPTPDFFYCNHFCPFKPWCDRQERDGNVQDALNAGTDPKEMQ